MNAPLMPKATAVWLLDNTTLTFEQIAAFCDLHLLEVQALADGESPILGLDPIANGQLTAEEIELCETDSARQLHLKEVLTQKERRTSGPKYTPLNKRQDKPDAVMWILRTHADLTDNQIIKLVGTTKSTIEKIKNRIHWNIQSIRPRNPVDLGICSQRDLDEILEKNKRKVEGKDTEEAKAKKPKKKTTPKKKPTVLKEKAADKTKKSTAKEKKSAVKKKTTKKVAVKKTVKKE